MENNNKNIINHQVLDERKDSIETGSATKGHGKLKVYFNAQNVEEAKKLVDNALEIREYLSAKVEVNFGK